MSDIIAQTADPKTKRILVVEDDDGLRDFFELILQTEGFQIEAAPTGEEGIKRAVEKPPDLLILDFMLPGIGGFEVLRNLQKGPAAGVPIIVATARQLDEKMIQQIRHEPNVKEYMTKPIQHGPFISFLHKTLGTRPNVQPKKEDTGGFGQRKRGW